MSFFVKKETRSFPEPLIPPFPGATAGGGSFTSSVSTDSALRVSAVWACVRLIADTVSMMPCNGHTMRNGQRVALDTDPALLRAPAAGVTFGEWTYMLLASLMLRGNAFGRVVRRDSMGYPVQIELLDPNKVSAPYEAGGLFKASGEDIPQADLFHVRAYPMPGMLLGLSPIKYAALAINREAAIQQFSYGYFVDAPHPSAMFLADGAISQPEADTLKKRVMAKLNGREPVFLGGGVKYQPLSVSPEESQFLATQKLGVAEIARIYGVPPEMIAAEAGNSMTYANVEQRGIDFLTYSIQPWLTRIEAAVSVLLPGGQHVRFDPSVLLRTDYHTLVQANSVGIASKQITPDEARAKLDLAPLTQAQKDILELVPLTVSPSGRPIVQPIGAGQPIADLTPTTPPQGAPA